MVNHFNDLYYIELSIKQRFSILLFQMVNFIFRDQGTSWREKYKYLPLRVGADSNVEGAISWNFLRTFKPFDYDKQLPVRGNYHQWHQFILLYTITVETVTYVGDHQHGDSNIWLGLTHILWLVVADFHGLSLVFTQPQQHSCFFCQLHNW